MPDREVRHARGLNGAVAAVLRQERRRVGMTIPQLARASDIPAVTVQRLLSASRAMRLEQLSQLCTALGVDEAQVVAAARAEIATGADADLVARVLDGLGARADVESL